jgi:hypothetical protein
MEVDVFLAKFRLQEAMPEDIDAFVAWAVPRYPEAPRLQHLAAMRPLPDDFDEDLAAPAIQEAGLTLPTPLAAALLLARHEMRRVVAREIEPEQGAGNIENLTTYLDPQEVLRIPELWNFCVYRRYLRAAGDMGDDRWYGQVVDDIVAEAEYHLGLRDRPPD